MVKRVSWTGALLLVVASLVAGAAKAHPIYVQAKVASSPVCVWASSSIAEGPASNGGQVFIEGWFQAAAEGFCLTAKNIDPGYALVRRELWRWNGVEWRLCATNGWMQASAPTSYIYRSMQWAPMPCGNNSYYGNYGGAFVFMSGQWHGNYVWAGYHLI